MAGITFGFLMLALELILGFLVMIENTAFPILGRMTSAALVAIAALVSFLVIVLAMAGNTIRINLQLGAGTTHSALVASFTLSIPMLVT